ncbi:hypothetical protein B0O99DRAFT_613942 [Bisporella sp. PMI_857]|nr:hypothetical protein B0O99DRAFT_613942 [Bisporella sp. PMI_857]
MTSSRHMLQHLDRLSATFGRRITGIHNRTYGPVLDVILPVLLSIFNINTSTSKALHTQLREAMLSQSCGKVIIIAHGTGAAILSEVMDRLHCDMPLDTMSKIEIYTFGSAARHMSNPCMIMNRPFDMSKISRDSKRDSIQTMRLEENERVIPHIEHYAMTTDLTANCGIMHHTMNVLDNRFCGRTFLVSRPGFLFDQYMDMLFPQISTAKRSSSHMSLSSGGILDTVAEVDSTMVEKREFTALGIHGTAMNGMKRMSLGRGISSISSINIPGVLSLEDMTQMVKDGKLVAGEAKAETRTDKNGKTMNGTHADAKEKKDRKQNLSMSMGSPVDGVTIAKCAAKECEGKSVRDLSRLWQYQNGRRPAGEGDLLKMGERLMGGLMNGLGMINPAAVRP